MAHWAELDENNIVTRVTVGDNNDPNGDEGLQWLIENLGGRWIKTSYNGNIRKNFAAAGYIFDETADAFYAPQPYPSWKLDRRSFTWKSPVVMPTDGKHYRWDEYSLSWLESSN